MRSDSVLFNQQNVSTITTPAAVLEIHFDNTDTDMLYLTSHDGITITGASNVVQGCLSDVNDASQSMDWRAYSASIGQLDFSAVDLDGAISTYMRGRFNVNKSAGFKFCKYYKGFLEIPFSDFTLACTQVITSIGYDDGEYSFTCNDIQRETKKDIFDPKLTTATANLTATGTTLNVVTTSGFEMLQHGNSYSDSPNVKLGYLRLKDGDDYEILRYTGKTANTFTGLQRGAFGTVPRAWEAINGDGSSADLEVEEFIYFELPVPKAILAILTGVIYNTPGETFPWNLGISDLWVATPFFTNIGIDLWDPTNDSTGFICRFAGLEKETGMGFIQEQLLALGGLIMPVLSTGELSLRRVTDVPAAAPFVTKLTADHIVEIDGGVTYAIDEIRNVLKIRWSWDAFEDTYLRTDVFPVYGSIDRYGKEAVTEKTFKGLHGSRHSRDSNLLAFRAWRDRLASEPLYLGLQLAPALDVLEVGDIVRVELENWEDYTAEQVAELNRSFEVQSVSTSWLDGVVNVELFGSSARIPNNIEDIAPGAATTAFTNAQLTAGGTNIETAYSGSVNRVGGLVSLTANITFVGNDGLATSAGVLLNAAKLYCNGDLSIPFGRTLNIQRDTVLICTGFLTIDGTINGKGTGKAGGLGTRYASYDQPGNNSIALIQTYNAAVAQAGRGFISPRMLPQGEIVGRTVLGELVIYTSYRRVSIPDADADGGVSPLYPYATVPELSVVAATMGGFPSTLQGSGGPAGLPGFESTGSGPVLYRLAGGDGGAGGAGLLIIARGVSFGVSGQINLSGNNAGTNNGLGKLAVGHNYDSQAGSGCPGAPGSLFVLIDGDYPAPLINANTLKANCGQASYKVINTVVGSAFRGGSPLDYAGMSGLLPTFSNIENYWSAYHRVQFVFAPTAVPGEDTPADALSDQVLGFTIQKYYNLPQTPAGDMVTVSVNVTPPTDTSNYSHSVVGYKKATQTSYTFIPEVAQNETAFSVKADGSTYDIIAFAVSKAGVQHPTGITTSTSVTTAATLPTGTKLEIGYDATTQTYLRVVNTADGSVIGGLSSGGSGTIGKVTAGAGSAGYDNLSDRPDFNNHINNGGDLIQNSQHLIAAADGRPAGVLACHGGTDGSVISYLDKPLGHIKVSGENTLGIAYPAFKTEPNTKYRIRVSVKASAAIATGFYVRGAEYDNNTLPDGVTHVAQPVSPVWEGTRFVAGTRSISNIHENAALSTTWTTLEFTYTPTSTARWFSLILLRWNQTADLHLRLVSVAPVINSSATQNKIFRQASAPVSGMLAEDLWYDSDDNNHPYWYSGSAWIDIRDPVALWSAVTGTGRPADNADVTQTALDAEVITAGGLVLSSGGAVRTTGKTDTDDGVEGVYLGDVAGSSALYAGDGADDFISYKEGEGLLLGKNTRVLSAVGAGNADQLIFIPSLFEVLTYDDNANANVALTKTTDGTRVQISSGAAVDSYGSTVYNIPLLQFKQRDWTHDYYFTTVVQINPRTAYRHRVGLGDVATLGPGNTWTAVTTAANGVFFEFYNGTLYAVAENNVAVLATGMPATATTELDLTIRQRDGVVTFTAHQRVVGGSTWTTTLAAPSYSMAAIQTVFGGYSRKIATDSVGSSVTFGPLKVAIPE